MSGLVFRVATACIGLVVTAALGCVPAPRAPVDLRTAEAKVIRFGLASGQGSICPGSEVPVEVQLEADVDGERVHVFQHRRDIDDRIFDIRQLHLSSPQGSFDERGVFHASDDVLATAQSGFVLHVRAPRGPAFAVRYPPAYDCGLPIGGEGARGQDGAPGQDAILGESEGAPSGDALAGGGKPGEPGGPGSAGPKIAVYVTWVRTPDYTKVLAARAVGDVAALTLVSPGTTLPVRARGGPGGYGGRGGRGAPGLTVKSRSGPGGTGGVGGDGGDGGEVELVLDERFAELERWVSVDVEGGEGGPGGAGGPGGFPGRAPDLGVSPDYVYPDPALPGAPGRPGERGATGRVHVRRAPAAEIHAAFANLGPLVPL